MAQIKTVDEFAGRAVQLDLGPDLRSDLDLVTVEQLATLLGVEEQTLAVWRSEGTGPDYVKLGKQVFYMRHQLKDWVLDNMRSPKAA